MTCGSQVPMSRCLYHPWTGLPNLVQRRQRGRLLLWPPSFQPPSSLTPTRSLCPSVKALEAPEFLGPDHLLRQQDATGSTLEGCWEEAKPQQAQEEWHHLHALLPFPSKAPSWPSFPKPGLQPLRMGLVSIEGCLDPDQSTPLLTASPPPHPGIVTSSWKPSHP